MSQRAIAWRPWSVLGALKALNRRRARQPVAEGQFFTQKADGSSSPLSAVGKYS